jgi:hypothetical protein
MGGGLDAMGLGSDVSLSNCSLEHNKALGGNGSGSGGGSLRSAEGATLTVISTTVTHNHAQGGGCARP